MYGKIRVSLKKRSGINLGLTVSGGLDRGEPPNIADIRPNSDADKSDSLLINDFILAINGTSTMNLRHEQIVQLAKSSKSRIVLDLQYELPEFPITDCRSEKCVIELDKIRDENFGMVIRGGWAKNSNQTRPLTVMCIRPNSSADLNGSVKPGDRILAINNISTDKYTCEEITRKLRKLHSPLKLLIEYSIANVDEGRNVPCSVVVEIEKMPIEKLGISLRSRNDPMKKDESRKKIFLIDYIKPASIADRCGALKIGDMVEAIDGMPLQNMTLEQAMNRIRLNRQENIRIQIVPNYSQKFKAYKDQMNDSLSQKSNKSSLYSLNRNSSFSEISDDGGKFSSNFDLNAAYTDDDEDSLNRPCSCDSNESCHGRPFLNRKATGSLDGSAFGRRKKNKKSFSRKSSCSLSNSDNSSIQSSSCYSSGSVSDTNVNIKKGYTMAPTSCPASPASQARHLQQELFLSSITGTKGNRSKSSKCKQTLSSGPLSPNVKKKPMSCKQSLSNIYKVTNDQHSKISYVPGLCVFDEITIQLVPKPETTQLANLSNFPVYGLLISVSNLPADSSGQDIFDTALKDYPIVSNLLNKGLAHQSGVIQEGDRLIAINEELTLGKSINEIMKRFLDPTPPSKDNQSYPSITLTLQYKIANSIVPDEGKFNVKLIRKGPSLGINLQTPIPGNSNGPLLISKVIPGTVANRSGVITPGDRLLAVNGVSLSSCSLNQAISLLQMPNDDIIDLKLEKAGGFVDGEGGNEEFDRDSRKIGEVRSPSSKYSSRQNTTEDDEFRNLENELKIDDGSRLIKVILNRESSSKPWGILISGTDDTKDNPIIIDSLTPKEPAEASGVLQSGDQIIAINGVNIQKGFTLSQAMEKLQQYKHHVIIHVMRRLRPSSSKRNRDLSSIRNSEGYQSFSKSLDYKSTTSPMQNLSREASSVLQPKPTKSSQRPHGRHHSGQIIHESSINSESYNSSHQESLQAPSTVILNPKKRLQNDYLKKILSPFDQNLSSKDLKILQTSAPLATFQHGPPSVVSSTGKHRRKPSLSHQDHSSFDEDQLDRIQCSGCRETIAAEIKQRKLLERKKRLNARNKSVEQMRRERSLPRSFEQSMGRELPSKPVELAKIRNISQDNSSINHSKSDTRLNKEKSGTIRPKKSAQPTAEEAIAYSYQSRTMPSKKSDSRHKMASTDGTTKSSSKTEMWIKLTKNSPYESYGIGVSEGLVTKGIFVSAIRPNSPAEKSGKIQLYDKIIQINKTKVVGLSCSQVVSLIGKSDLSINLLIQRIKG